MYSNAITLSTQIFITANIFNKFIATVKLLCGSRETLHEEMYNFGLLKVNG